MVIYLSPSPPSLSSLIIKFSNSKRPILESPLRFKTHISKSLLSPSFTSPTVKLTTKKQFLHQNRNRVVDFRTCATGGVEGPQSVLEALAVLTAIVVVHESGHFLAASLQGIHVSKFAVGLGPILAKFNAKNVEYSIRAFPFGGFVGFPDNDPDSGIPVDDVDLLKNRPVLDRIIVVSAGVVANVVFALVIIFVQVLTFGFTVQDIFPGVNVTEVRPFLAASRDGLLSGDVILEVNGNEFVKPGLNSVSELGDVIKRSPKKYVLLKVKRGGQDFEIRVTPDKSFFDGTGKIGVRFAPNIKLSKVRPKNVVEAVTFTAKEFWGLSSNVLYGLKQTFLNFSQTASMVGGPVAIIAIGAEAARLNIDYLYQFAAILNINLAIINLLPLPPLDGGTLALILVEAARGGRKLPKEVEREIKASGGLFFLLLGSCLIVRDTFNLIFL